MHRSLPLPLALSLLLAACSGGGGGGGGGGISAPLNGPATPFTSFTDIDPETLVQFDSPVEGIEPQTVNYRAARDEITGEVSQLGNVTNDPSTLLVYFDGAIDPVQARLSTEVTGGDDILIDFTGAPTTEGIAGSFQQFAIGGGIDPITDRVLVHLDGPGALEYMTFGMWALGFDTAQVDIGAAHWGSRAVAVPDALAPNADYNGELLGTWINNLGEVSYYEADATLTARFADGFVDIASTNTRNLETGVPLGGLDIFNNTPATINGNTFTGGTFGVVADGLSFGDWNGAFYGPNAEEAGASFAVDFANGRYFGSLGGAR